MRHLTRFVFILISALSLCAITYAEDGILVIQVIYPNGKAIPGVMITATGDGSQAMTDDAGKARLKLAPGTHEGSDVTLSLVRLPEGKDLRFVSPWDGKVKVPSFANNSNNAVVVRVIEAGDRAWLEYGIVTKAFITRINEANVTQSPSMLTADERLKNLMAVAEDYKLTPAEVDSAIRAWGAKTNDPYEKGLFAFYVKNYSEAIRQFLVAVEEQKNKVKKTQEGLADRYASLGQAYYEDGSYREAANAFQEAALLRPDNSLILNELGLAQHSAGEYSQAEASYKRALAIGDKELGPKHPDVAKIINNLATLYYNQAKYPEAESRYKQALDIKKELLGQDDPEIAVSLGNLGTLYEEQG